MARGFDPIPRSKLENATRLNVLKLMVDQYGESDASNITVQVLKQLNQNKLASELEQNIGEKLKTQGRVVEGKSFFFILSIKSIIYLSNNMYKSLVHI